MPGQSRQRRPRRLQFRDLHIQRRDPIGRQLARPRLQPPQIVARSKQAVDVVDAQQKRLIWEGVAIGRVTEKVQRHRAEAIDKAVAEIFKAYPVPARP